mgnify:CR=1 FL=1
MLLLWSLFSILVMLNQIISSLVEYHILCYLWIITKSRLLDFFFVCCHWYPQYSLSHSVVFRTLCTRILTLQILRWQSVSGFWWRLQLSLHQIRIGGQGYVSDDLWFFFFFFFFFFHFIPFPYSSSSAWLAVYFKIIPRKVFWKYAIGFYLVKNCKWAIDK